MIFLFVTIAFVVAWIGGRCFGAAYRRADVEQWRQRAERAEIALIEITEYI